MPPSHRLYGWAQATFRGIDEDSSLAINKISVTDDNTDKEKIKGLAVDHLIGKGYKVVAKEYL